MPRVGDDFLSCVVYLYLTRSHAEEGERFGGAGFLVGIPEGSREPLFPEGALFHHGAYGKASYQPHHLYVATNSHVGRSCHFFRLNRRDGTASIHEVEPNHWFFHEASDIAVAPIEWTSAWGRDYGLVVVPHLTFLSLEELRSIDVGPGDDTFTVGRFITHDGRERNLPIVRFGNIAMLPLEPIETENGNLQNVFLIESRTVQGYSGSPVFLSIPPWELRESGRNTLRQSLGKNLGNPGDRLGDIKYYTRLLGIVTATLADRNGENTGMMAAVPAWELLELLNHDRLRRQRQVESEKWRKEGVARSEE
jgi:hypothetical protein